jgi:hypothetical protein
MYRLKVVGDHPSVGFIYCDVLPVVDGALNNGNDITGFKLIYNGIVDPGARAYIEHLVEAQTSCGASVRDLRATRSRLNRQGGLNQALLIRFSQSGNNWDQEDSSN